MSAPNDLFAPVHARVDLHRIRMGTLSLRADAMRQARTIPDRGFRREALDLLTFISPSRIRNAKTPTVVLDLCAETLRAVANVADLTKNR